eukprot:CAMPEP_0202447836 /NCGR_PEP_ID=MMETSP1360-20130828/6606_1 /ASSEMBLY_ACC=CAM_ASM_000848 /TAXON_ID=515479 /ORGANISM="Licmophora paradoxa, Strain CCMP2313" /LENGTH=80 /DNA_ID=CAMNT_0049065105 /DNA_START=15 /DNA_END=258 /DNA_ORIENTATION=+
MTAVFVVNKLSTNKVDALLPSVPGLMLMLVLTSPSLVDFSSPQFASETVEEEPAVALPDWLEIEVVDRISIYGVSSTATA